MLEMLSSGKENSADVRIVRTCSMSSTVLIDFLPESMTRSEIFSAMSSLSEIIVLTYNTIRMPENGSSQHQAKISFDSKASALGFCRKSGGQFLSNCKNVSFDHSDAASVSQVSEPTFCFLSLRSVQDFSLETGMTSKIEKIAASCGHRVVTAADAKSIAKFSEELLAPLRDSKSDLVLLFESWHDAKAFWKLCAMFDVLGSFTQLQTFFGVFSEKSWLKVVDEFESKDLLDIGHPVDRSVIMDSFIQKIIKSGKFDIESHRKQLKRVADLPLIINKCWTQRWSVCYLGLRFAFGDGAAKLTMLSLLSDESQVITAVDPTRPESESKALLQLITFLESKESGSVLFLPSIYVYLPVLLKSLHQCGLLERFLSVLDGVADLCSLFRATRGCKAMVESDRKFYLVPSLGSFEEAFQESNPHYVEAWSDAFFVQSVASAFLTTPEELDIFLSANVVPRDAIKLGNSDLYPMTITEDIVMEPGEVDERRLALTGPMSENAIFVESHLFEDIQVKFELKDAKASVVFQNVSNRVVSLPANHCIGTLLPHPDDVLCPANVSFLQHERVISAKKSIAALRPRPSQAPDQDLNDGLCFAASSGGLRSSTDVAFGPIPADDFAVVFLAAKVQNIDGEIRPLEILLREANDVFQEKSLFLPKDQGQRLADQGYAKIGGKYFRLIPSEQSQLLPVVTYDQFFCSTLRHFNGRKVILVGFQILQLLEIMQPMFATAGNSAQAWVEAVSGCCDLDWILPMEKQSLSDKSFSELVAEHLGSETALKPGSLSSIVDISKKFVANFCTDFSFDNFVSKFVLASSVCKDLIKTGHSRSKILFKRSTISFEIERDHQQQQRPEATVEPLTRDRIKSLKLLAQKFQVTQTVSSAPSGLQWPLDLQKSAAEEPSADLESNTKACGGKEPDPSQELTSRPSSLDFEMDPRDSGSNETYPAQEVPSLQAQEGHQSRSAAEPSAQHLPASNMTVPTSPAEAPEFHPSKSSHQNHRPDFFRRKADPPKPARESPVGKSPNQERANQELISQLSARTGSSDANGRSIVPVFCYLSCAKPTAHQQYISSIDFFVPSFPEFSLCVDSVKPPEDLPDNLKGDFFNLKDGVWISKDCNNPRPTIKSEGEVVTSLVRLLNDLRHNQDETAADLILVTVLPNHHHYLENVIQRHAKKSLYSFFRGWCDLTDLVYSSTTDCHLILKSSSETLWRLDELLAHVCPGKTLSCRKTEVMAEILRRLAQKNTIESIVGRSWVPFALEQADQLLHVYVHVETLKIAGKLFWKTVGFHTPHNYRDLLAPIIPDRHHEMEYIAHKEFSKNGSVWTYKPNDKKGLNSPCVDQRSAVLKMAKIIMEECNNNELPGFVLTGLNLSSGVIHILKAFVDLGLDDLLKKIKGVGDVTTSFENLKNSSKSLQPFCNIEDLYRSISKRAKVAPFADQNSRGLAICTRELAAHLKSKNAVVNHPIKSPYANYLLFVSQFDVFRDNFGDVVLSSDFDGPQSDDNLYDVSLRISGCLFTHTRETFQFHKYPFSKVQLINKPVLTLENSPFQLRVFIPARALPLKKGTKVGQVSKVPKVVQTAQTLPAANARDPRLRSSRQASLDEKPTERTEELKTLKRSYSSAAEISGSSSITDQDERPNKIAKVLTSKFPTIEEVKRVSSTSVEINQERIDFELNKFDSIFIFKNLRDILVPYVIYHLEEGRPVPLEPGESFVLVLASCEVFSTSEFIEQLGLDPNELYVVAYLMTKILDRYPNLGSLLPEHDFLTFVCLIQDLVTDKARQYYPSLFKTGEIPTEETGTSGQKLERMAEVVQTTSARNSELKDLDESTDGRVDEQSRPSNEANLLEMEAASPKFSDDSFDENGDAGNSSLESCENEMKDQETEQDHDDVEPMDIDDSFGGEEAQLEPVEPEPAADDLEAVQDSHPSAEDEVPSERSEDRRKTRLEIEIDKLGGKFLQNARILDRCRNLVVGVVASETSIRLPSGSSVRFHPEANQEILPFGTCIEPEDAVLVALDGDQHCELALPLSLWEQFSDCRFGFVLSQPQKKKTCVGFEINRQLFRAMVPSDKIISDTVGVKPLEVGQVVAIKLALPVSRSEKVSSDCQANFCVVSASLTGSVIAQSDVNMNFWEEISIFFESVSLRSVFDHTTESTCYLFEAESSELIHEALHFLKAECSKTFAWQPAETNRVTGFYRATAEIHQVKLKRLGSSLLVAGSLAAVEESLAWLAQKLAEPVHELTEERPEDPESQEAETNPAPATAADQPTLLKPDAERSEAIEHQLEALEDQDQPDDAADLDQGLIEDDDPNSEKTQPIDQGRETSPTRNEKQEIAEEEEETDKPDAVGVDDVEMEYIAVEVVDEGGSDDGLEQIDSSEIEDIREEKKNEEEETLPSFRVEVEAEVERERQKPAAAAARPETDVPQVRCRQFEGSVCAEWLASSCDDLECNGHHGIPRFLNVTFCKHYLRKPNESNTDCQEIDHFKMRPHLSVKEVQDLFRTRVGERHLDRLCECFQTEAETSRRVVLEDQPRPQAWKAKKGQRNVASREALESRYPATQGCVHMGDVQQFLCMHFFVSQNCRYGSGCFKAHHISAKIGRIDYCLEHLRQACQRHKCRNNHISWNQLVKLYTKKRMRVIENCPECVTGADDHPKDLRSRLQGGGGRRVKTEPRRYNNLGERFARHKPHDDEEDQHGHREPSQSGADRYDRKVRYEIVDCQDDHRGRHEDHLSRLRRASSSPRSVEPHQRRSDHYEPRFRQNRHAGKRPSFDLASSL